MHVALVEDSQHDVDRESAAMISIGSLDRDDWNAWAVP